MRKKNHRQKKQLIRNYPGVEKHNSSTLCKFFSPAPVQVAPPSSCAGALGRVLARRAPLLLGLRHQASAQGPLPGILAQGRGGRHEGQAGLRQGGAAGEAPAKEGGGDRLQEGHTLALILGGTRWNSKYISR